MSLLIFCVYFLITLIVGWLMVQYIAKELPFLLTLISAYLLGTTVSVPLVYELAVLFAKTIYPLSYALVITILIMSGLGFFIFKRLKKQIVFHPVVTTSEIFLIGFSLVFSIWMMSKTFHAGAGDTIFVGSNNVFDFGNSLGIIRSFSWGSNIPMMSPFAAGQPFYYHFFFNFWVALWEYSGVPIVWALNIPSALAFASLVILIYYLPTFVGFQKPIIGWISILLFITNSSMTIWLWLIQKGVSSSTFLDLWNIPTYPFAGPYDGSIISIFITLNNFINQRHLAGSIAVGILIYVLLGKQINEGKFRSNTIYIIGCILGILSLWNIAITIISVLMILILLVLNKLWNTVLHFLLSFLITAGIINFRYVLNIFSIFSFLRILIPGDTTVISNPVQNRTILEYLLMNLGILPFVAGLGFFVLPKKYRLIMIPGILLFIFECIFAGVGSRGFDQKFYSYLIIMVNLCAGIGLYWLWCRKLTVFKYITVAVFALLILSGIIDLLPIKNEFAYPFVDSTLSRIIVWIRDNTPKKSVFISYADIVDPVALSGRYNYYGFFGNIRHEDRSHVVRRIYNGDVTLAKQRNISHILLPKWDKNGFPYQIDINVLKQKYNLEYEDDRYTIYSVY